MVAVESVDGPREEATKTGKTSGTGTPAKAEAADKKPQVVYVGGAAKSRSAMSMRGWLSTAVVSAFLLI